MPNNQGNGIALGSPFSPRYGKFLDDRESFATKEELKNFDTSSIPDGFKTYCQEDDNYYKFKSDYPESEETGKWKLIVDSIDDTKYVKVETFEEVKQELTLTNKETVEKLSKDEDGNLLFNGEKVNNIDLDTLTTKEDFNSFKEESSNTLTELETKATFENKDTLLKLTEEEGKVKFNNKELMFAEWDAFEL